MSISHSIIKLISLSSKVGSPRTNNLSNRKKSSGLGIFSPSFALFSILALQCCPKDIIRHRGAVIASLMSTKCLSVNHCMKGPHTYCLKSIRTRLENETSHVDKANGAADFVFVKTTRRGMFDWPDQLEIVLLPEIQAMYAL